MEEEIILLQDFINGKIQQDKLENYKGGYKLGFFYTKDLQKAIENLIARNKKLESALDNSISKDKIKAKIAELDEEINSKEAPIYAYPLIVERDALQELLNKGE